MAKKCVDCESMDWEWVEWCLVDVRKEVVFVSLESTIRPAIWEERLATRRVKRVIYCLRHDNPLLSTSGCWMFAEANALAQ